MMENIDYMMTEVQPHTGTYTFRITVDGTTYTQQGAVFDETYGLINK
jgi:hypothetical protein